MNTFLTIASKHSNKVYYTCMFKLVIKTPEIFILFVVCLFKLGIDTYSLICYTCIKGHLSDQLEK